MLELNSKLIVCKTPQEEKLLKMQIDNLDKQMNRINMGNILNLKTT